MIIRGFSFQGNGKKSADRKSSGNSTGDQEDRLRHQDPGTGDTHNQSIYRFPLRPGHTVEIRNIPNDLKVEEVWRLACFVATLAHDFRPGGSPFGEMVVAKS